MNNSKLRYLNEYITQKDPKEDYKVLKSIGSGTYGQVYKAINKNTNVYAAVKLIKIEMNDNIKSIVREIHILRSCSHPNIVNYFGSYLRKDRLWICMEFCGGYSMQDIYLRWVGGVLLVLVGIRRPLDENCIAFVTRETLQGLAYMHSKGKIHRDIKVVRRANCANIEDLMVALEDGWNAISMEDCDGYYRHMKRELRLAMENLPFN